MVYPVHCHHDKIPKWWDFFRDDNGGKPPRTCQALVLKGVRGEKSTKNAIFFVKKYCRQHQRKIWKIKEKLSLLQNATEESRARNCGRVRLGGRVLVGGVHV